MKIYDCITYFDEPILFDLRLNILDRYVDKFIVIEAKHTHSGREKKLNFDIKKFPEFKKKIIYLPIENEPQNIIYKNKSDTFLENEEDKRTNSIKRINHQRDRLKEGLSEANEDDYVLYRDNDEIPNLENFNFETSSSKILIFKQKLFYYKFNLFFDRISWFGTKGCKKKDLLSLSWLRDVKSKKYPIYRVDTIFSKTKYTNVEIIENGGWHFSQLKTAKDIEKKLEQSLEQAKILEKQLKSLQQSRAADTAKDLVGQMETIGERRQGRVQKSDTEFH